MDFYLGGLLQRYNAVKVSKKEGNLNLYSVHEVKCINTLDVDSS